MAKVSVGVRGWRFDEAAIFTDDGSLRPIDEMPESDRNRLIRLSAILGEPCDACWLIHGSEHIDRADQVEIVYGEPMAEVLLCADHEADFLYWFREEGGNEFAGTATLQTRFHEWFDDGGRAPADYAGLDHVDAAPDRLPAAADDGEIQAVESQVSTLSDDERAALDIDLEDLDV